MPSFAFWTSLNQTLGVTNTYPTIKFNPSEIVRTHDARAGSAHVRKLQQDRADVPMACSDSKVSVMNDVGTTGLFQYLPNLTCYRVALESQKLLLQR